MPHGLIKVGDRIGQGVQNDSDMVGVGHDPMVNLGSGGVDMCGESPRLVEKLLSFLRRRPRR